MRDSYRELENVPGFARALLIVSFRSLLWRLSLFLAATMLPARLHQYR